MRTSVGARLAVVLLVALLAASAGRSVRSQEHLPLADFAALKLRVAKVEVVPEIARSWGGETRRLSAEEGWKLVVVTLNGRAPQPCDLMAGSREFFALFDLGGAPELFSSEAVALGEDWSIPPEEAFMVVRQSVSVAGPVTIRVAFLLPEEVTQFTVRYPATATGAAKVPSP